MMTDEEKRERLEALLLLTHKMWDDVDTFDRRLRKIATLTDSPLFITSFLEPIADFSKRCERETRRLANELNLLNAKMGGY